MSSSRRHPRRPCSIGSTCADCPGLGSAVWAALAPDEIRLLDSARRGLAFRPGDVLFEQGAPCNGIYCIESGEVILRRRDAAGHGVVLRRLGSSEAVGYRAFFSRQPHGSSAEALTDCLACFVPADMLRQLMGASRGLAEQFLQRAVRELDEADEMRVQQAVLPVRARFAMLLLGLREAHGAAGADGGLSLRLPLSRQDIAAVLCTTPETVARTVRAFADDGVAVFRGRDVHVPDLDVLLDEVEP